MFRNLTSQLTAAASSNPNNGDKNKVLSPTLRTDIYSAVDQVKAWTIGGLGSGTAGDGVSYNPILTTIQKHFPNIKLGIESIGNAENELAVIVGGVTNMVLELCRWEGMAGGMAMRTWVDALVEAHARVEEDSRKERIAKGLTRGINENTDVTLVPKEFTIRIQVISILKSVSSRIYDSGSEEARQGEAIWSSKFL